jgi:RNA polymerase sigma-70 factor, ECF subfamily
VPQMDALIERDAIARFQAGDDEAYGELFAAHQRRVTCLALHVLRDEASALDVAQDVLLRAFEELPHWRGEARLSTWLHRTALHVCSEYIRAEGRQRRNLARVSEIGAMPSPERSVLKGEVKAAIARAMERLPPRQRAVFVLRQHHDMRFAEIARRLGISEGCVRASYHNARSSLREWLRALAPETPSLGATTGA